MACTPPHHGRGGDVQFSGDVVERMLVLVFIEDRLLGVVTDLVVFLHEIVVLGKSGIARRAHISPSSVDDIDVVGVQDGMLDGAVAVIMHPIAHLTTLRADMVFSFAHEMNRFGCLVGFNVQNFQLGIFNLKKFYDTI